MSGKSLFYKCEVCGNIVYMIKRGGGQLVCCGKEMQAMKANSTDASQEKHVPVIERKNGKLLVEVGSVIHPMTPEHYIEWIAVVSDKCAKITYLTPEDQPKAEFLESENAEIYAYCNLHGLWVVSD